MTLPADYPELYTSILLGGTYSPGTVKITGHDRPKKWDVQSAKGQQGASDKLNGDDPGTFTCAFYLAGDHSEADGELDDFDRWDSFQKLIESTTNGPKPTALSIYHPDLLRQGFTEVSNGGVSGLIHDGLGGATVTVKFIEYKPAKPKPVVGATARGGSRGGSSVILAPDPNAAAKAELAGLVTQAQQP